MGFFLFLNLLLDLYAESVEGLALTLNEELAITHYLCVLNLVTLNIVNAGWGREMINANAKDIAGVDYCCDNYMCPTIYLFAA